MGANNQWIMIAKKIQLFASSLWMGIWSAWKEVRQGIIQKHPLPWIEIARQPLFGNNLICSSQGGNQVTTKKGKFRIWSLKGFSKILDLWNLETEIWKTAQVIRTTLRSCKMEGQRMEILESIPWNLADAPNQFEPGEWLAWPPPFHTFFHVHSIRAGIMWAWIYHADRASDQLHRQTHDPIEIPTIELSWIRVASRVGLSGKIKDFNPKENPLRSSQFGGLVNKD